MILAHYILWKSGAQMAGPIALLFVIILAIALVFIVEGASAIVKMFRKRG